MLAAVGQRLQLFGISKRGKQLLLEFNTVWRVVQIEDRVRFSQLEGPWLLVEALMEDRSKRLRSSRWIHGRQDENFMIVKEI